MTAGFDAADKESKRMRWFQDLRPSAKLFAGFGLLMVFLAVVIATAHGMTANYQPED
jgi:hypothetical protein